MVAAPRGTVPVLRLTGVPCPDGRGGVGTLATIRALPAEAAVGLLSRDRSTLRGALGGGGGGAALRTFASDAAVGANRPDEDRGVGGTEVVLSAVATFLDDGVFGREPGVFGLRVAYAEGVGDLAVVR
jgi:hypothetical protein